MLEERSDEIRATSRDDENAFEAQIAALTNLANVTNELLDAEDINAMLVKQAEYARSIFKAYACLISLWDIHEKTYYPRVAVGIEKEAFAQTHAYGENDELARLQSADILVYGQLAELSEIWQAFFEILPQGSMLALPLGADGQKVGILHIFYNEPHNFSADELTYAKLASRQISQAIWKVILLTQAKAQVQELRVLHEISVVLPSANDESSLLKDVITILGETLYPHYLVILLVDANGNVLTRESNYPLGFKGRCDGASVGRGIMGRVVKSGLLEHYDDVSEAPDYIAALPNIRSEIAVPIKTRKKVLGVINVESESYAAFGERDERILRTVANQMAAALTRLRAEQAQIERVLEIARSNDLIHGLTEVASQMETSSEPIAVMEQMGIALDRKGIKTLIALFESESQDLSIRYTSLDPTVVRKLERLGGVSMKDFRISSKVLPDYISLSDNLRPVILNDYLAVIARILREVPSDMLRRLLGSTLDLDRTMLGHFPLIYREKVLGFLWLWGESLREEDLPTLSVFANQVASSLENARLFADVQRLAITDGLTQLYTRRHFFELAYEEFYRARRYGRPLCVLMLDLDHFKNVNDTYGHAAGDTALEKAAETCRKTLRTNDIVGRYGGEEIVILLVETRLDAAYQIALRIAENIRNLVISSPKGDVRLTVSVGVAGDNVERQNLIEMIEAADQALYAAKRNGRDRVEIARVIPADFAD